MCNFIWKDNETTMRSYFVEESLEISIYFLSADINACARSPCLSGGHCVDLKVGFRCECKQGYWGKRCEKEVDECALKPCLNGGKCLDKVGRS